jgi:hypothetical protein
VIPEKPSRYGEFAGADLTARPAKGNPSAHHPADRAKMIGLGFPLGAIKTAF